MLEERVLDAATSSTMATVKSASQSATSKIATSIGRSFTAHPFMNLLNVGFGLHDYNTSRKEGDGKLKAGAKAIGTFAAGEIFGMGYVPIMFAVAGAQAAIAGGEIIGQVASANYKRKGTIGDGNFSMSQAGYTMRQRSVNAMQQNGMNVNSVLGNEARTFFRTSGYN